MDEWGRAILGIFPAEIEFSILQTTDQGLFFSLPPYLSSREVQQALFGPFPIRCRWCPPSRGSSLYDPHNGAPFYLYDNSIPLGFQIFPNIFGIDVFGGYFRSALWGRLVSTRRLDDFSKKNVLETSGVCETRAHARLIVTASASFFIPHTILPWIVDIERASILQLVNDWLLVRFHHRFPSFHHVLG